MENQTTTTAPKPELNASVNLVNDKLHFIGTAGDNAPIDLDYTPPIGDNLGYMPLQVFLMSFSACAGGSVLFLLRRMMGRTIKGLVVNAKGIRRTQHPTSFERIDLEFELTSGDVEISDMDHAISESEKTYCPIWAMIKNNVEVKTGFKIIKV